MSDKQAISMSRGLKEKIILLSIGTVVTFITFLVSSYTSSFVTLAEYNKDKAVNGAILERLDNIEDDIKEIKYLVKKIPSEENNNE